MASRRKQEIRFCKDGALSEDARTPNNNKPSFLMMPRECLPNAKIKQYIAPRNSTVPRIFMRESSSLRGTFRFSLYVPFIRQNIITRNRAIPVRMLLWHSNGFGARYIKKLHFQLKRSVNALPRTRPMHTDFPNSLMTRHMNRSRLSNSTIVRQLNHRGST